MSNAISIEPLKALARRAARKIPNAQVARRFEHLALAALLKDESNFRPAADWEISRGPDWAQHARERGEAVSVAQPQRGCALRLHNVARRLANVCRLAELGIAESQPHAALITSARAFLDRLDRANFDTVTRKALYFSRLFDASMVDQDARLACGGEVTPATLGRTWRRVTSVRELRAIGREFRNCLARTSWTSSYGGMLDRGHAQFWVLRDRLGAGMMIAMAPAPKATYFSEVRGPRNARVAPEDPDLRQLALAIGVIPNDPSPPPPPHPPATPAAQAERIRPAIGVAPELIAARAAILARMRAHLLRSVSAA